MSDAERGRLFSRAFTPLTQLFLGFPQQVAPQAKFHLKLKERGYFPRNYCAKRSGYYNQPTEHQLASYGSEILAVVKQNRVHEFQRLLECGLSPNACNNHGESLLHMVCRHGKVDLFHVLVAYEVDVQQTDDYGRTAMHDACWAANPSFDIARWLLHRDPAMMSLFDARGSLPLSYVTKSLWGEWNAFLDGIMDEVFPAGSPVKDVTPELCTMKPDSRPVPDPKDKMPAELANQVANGHVLPHEAMAQMGADDATATVMTEEDNYDDEDSSYYSDSDSDWDSDEEEELFEIVGHLRLGTVEE